ncbi:nucleotidyltransferase family protein [Patescibacteria group bacterium]|nr:nucleotidyltransferase family protein [Patescibacteria group bacterium]MBU4000350.1 nucleotidyltransferase family protein [Patescibacteria group bacterium]MBU4056762.1 nucleotidyltransferase family protein [Patescibacteria group bacterium]MBU4368787.1 nucleotidyltransferase family protein [Patescibacteria group bacterium]
MKNISLFLLKNKSIPILKRYGVRRAAVFGSFARKQTRKSSDIDILVDIQKDISLLDFIGLKLEIEEALGKKVDLVEYNTIKPLIKKRIIKEQLVIL